MPEGRTPKAENKKGKGEEMGRGGGMAKEAWGGWKRERKDCEVTRFGQRKKTEGSNSSDQEPLCHSKESPHEEVHKEVISEM